MFGPRYPLLASVMLLTAASAAASTPAEPPKIGKPHPVSPATPSNVLPLPPAQFDSSLAIGGKDVKAREIDTRLSVDVRVNGQGPYRFIVDSGADSSAVGLRIANGLALPLGTPVVLNGTTGRDVVDRVQLAELTLGPTIIRNLQVPALREIDLGGDGLIGIDALVEQRLMMDFDTRMIKVEDARAPAEFWPGDIVITARRQRGQLILTEVETNGIRLDAVIDTGSEVTIGNSALRDKLLSRNPKQFWMVSATGVTGETVKLQMAKVAELQLGPVVLGDVPIAFADVPPFALFGLSDRPALLLGTDLLSTFRRVSLDFRARKVRFQLRHCEQDVIVSTAPPDFYSRLWSRSGADVCTR